MRPYQRVAALIADEGIIGAAKRVVDRYVTRSSQPSVDLSEVTRLYGGLVDEFGEKTADIDFPGLDRFYWHHTVDLGSGIVTPGDYDFRPLLDSFLFPDDMSGMQVLDIGSATGFFAFEFEKRGATVTSVELPTIADWDMVAEYRQQTLTKLMKYHGAEDVEELHYLHLDGPFLFCRQMLDSNVSRCYSSIYDLSVEKLNNQQFDLVFAGDVLVHLFSPLRALSSIGPLCRGKLVISQSIPRIGQAWPASLYLGGGYGQGDNRSWSQPNRECLRQMLGRVGFRAVEFVGEFSPMERRSGVCSSRTVVHATK